MRLVSCHVVVWCDVMWCGVAWRGGEWRREGRRGIRRSGLERDKAERENGQDAAGRGGMDGRVDVLTDLELLSSLIVLRLVLGNILGLFLHPLAL